VCGWWDWFDLFLVVGLLVYLLVGLLVGLVGWFLVVGEWLLCLSVSCCALCCIILQCFLKVLLLWGLRIVLCVSFCFMLSCLFGRCCVALLLGLFGLHRV